MKINPISFNVTTSLSRNSSGTTGRDFSSLVKDKLEEINSLHKEADTMTQKFLTGDVEDLHQVMLAAERASLTMQLAVQIRNKIIEAYQEISRMQV